ncbi:C40 family peptidase [Pseudoflavonifractor phocaeensis]|nr:NlpC/P60 family protein [Pseudoflavonifractor phocaeensis]MCF2676692.1 C40 family peptidase [Pseudoflavonifractor phocaeensis]
MDKPKALNRDFVPKEAGSIWKAHHDQQEAQRGPKERGSVQYATDQVETTSRRSAFVAADGGRRAIRQIKKRHDRAEPVGQEKTATELKKNNPSADGAYQSSPYDSYYPSARRDGTRQAAEQHHVEMGKENAVENHLGSASFQEIHSSFVVPHPRTGRFDVHSPHSPQSAPLEQGRKKAVRDAVKKHKAAQQVWDGRGAASGVEQTVVPPAQVGRPQVKTRQSRPGAAAHRQRTVKTAIGVKDAEPIKGATAKATQKARQAVQRRLQRKMVMRSAGSTQRGVRQLGQWAAAAAKTIVHTVKAAVSGLFAAGGGVVVLILLLLLIMVGAIAASPFGILFSNESSTPDAVPISAAIAQVNYDFNAQLEALQGADTYDDVTIAGEMADWVDVLAIFAVKTAGSNDVDATDVVTMDADRVNRLKAVFSDMNFITSTVETIHHADSDPDDDTDDSWTEKILHITITGKTAAEMETEYGFTAQQMTAVDELLAQRDMLEELIGNLTAISADAADILRNLPADLAPERREVIKTACSLVGKVNYFWGGKSLVMGWDSRWGTVQRVTADGSASTGTYRPYGLDCSGFVDWVFYNATEGNYIIGHGGGAASQHTYCTAISWADALPGDLVFYPDDTHVGIIAGWDENGNIRIVHCASGYNNVLITGKEGFVSIGRPIYFTE